VERFFTPEEIRELLELAKTLAASFGWNSFGASPPLESGKEVNS